MIMRVTVSVGKEAVLIPFEQVCKKIVLSEGVFSHKELFSLPLTNQYLSEVVEECGIVRAFLVVFEDLLKKKENDRCLAFIARALRRRKIRNFVYHLPPPPVCLSS
jgi:hypothetical protein